MNLLKHMEVIFGLVLTAGLLLAAAVDHNANAAAPAPAHRSASAPAVNIIVAQPIARTGTMAVVVVKGKRMSSRDRRRAALADGPMRIF